MNKQLLLGLLITSSINLASAGQCRCLPSQACWPDAKAWHSLTEKLSGRLIKPQLPLTACQKNPDSAACKTALKNIKNPFFLQSTPGGSESRGWLNAWKEQASTYAVEAKNTQDVVAAVNFARQHNLRLVIKGAGHDYLGRSNAPNSLLIWTHNMREISYHKHFIAAGCKNAGNGVPAITVGAGTRWLEAYNAATNQHHMYVQGGGCTTVGAAGGFTQGGGFGSFSKNFGTGAASVLQAQVVTANGQVLTVNQCQHPDLFYAIRGGGGGTFGVVTKMTLKMHPLPSQFGVIFGKITADNSADYKLLMQRFLTFFIRHLNNKHWGEQFAFNPDNSISLTLMTQGLTKQQVTAIWRPFQTFIDQSHGKYHMQSKYITIPATKLWNLSYWQKNHPELVAPNRGKDARPGEYWWTPNSGEVYRYWYTYQSRWLPATLFNPANIKKTTDVLFKASRLTRVALHINKALAGAATAAIKAGQQTSTNPAAYKAAALVILNAGNDVQKLDAKGHPILNPAAQATVKKIDAAMRLITAITPNAGTYANEADYFQKNWQQDFWGENYAKLLKIKQRYDPNGLFYCHHCVGSEAWQDGGMCRVSH